MAIVSKNLIVNIRRCVLFPLKIIYRLAHDRPFSLAMVIFLHLLHRYRPALFEFLVSSSPVFVCTALLLGTLLIYGEPNIPETKASHVRNRTRAMEKKPKVASKEITSADIRTIEDVPVTSASHSLVSEDIKGINDATLHDQGLNKMSEYYEGKRAESAVIVNEDEGLDKKIRSDLEGHIGSSRDYSSGSESDEEKNSSPDGSVADFIPLLNDLHPLLDSEAPLLAHESTDNSDATSTRTSEDNESEDNSVDEETENQEDDEEEEAQEEKEDTSEAVVSWTADDQKNLMDLGSSELERNQRLENLIAKRTARKFLSFHAQKNLIDLDFDDVMPKTDDLSHVQIAPVTVPRRNPFDLPFDAEENTSLPPAPGSAPSVLQPGRNPFDLPLDQVEASDSSRRETSYPRHENSTSEEPRYKFKPYFVPETMVSEETGLAVLQRLSSEKSDSKVDSGDESDTDSSTIDQEDHKELLEDLHHENDLDAHDNHYVMPVERSSESSEEVDSVDNDDDDRVIQLNSHPSDNAFGAVEMEIRQGESESPHSDDGSLEVIEEMYGYSSSSTSEAYGKNSKNDSKDSDTRTTTETTDDTQSVDPVYDSSPSAVANSSSSTPKFEETLLSADKEPSSITHENEVPTTIVSSNNIAAKEDSTSESGSTIHTSDAHESAQ